MKQKAFTLIELLVVMAIVGILASIVLFSANTARIHSRDAVRKTQLLQLQIALSAYYSDHHAYPISREFPGPDNDANYPGDYILNLAPTYIAQLPHDPLTGTGVNQGPPGSQCIGTTGAGFKYVSNGIDYKLVAFCVVEEQVATTDPLYNYTHPYYSYTVNTPGAVDW